MGRKHNLEEVLGALRKKNDVRVIEKTVQVLTPFAFNNKTMQMEANKARKNDVGIKSLGKIDFLVNHCGYKYQKVNSFNQ